MNSTHTRPTMGGLFTRFQAAVFSGLNAFSRWQYHPTINAARYESSLKQFIREYGCVQRMLHPVDYEKQLIRFEEFVNEIEASF